MHISVRLWVLFGLKRLPSRDFSWSFWQRVPQRNLGMVLVVVLAERRNVFPVQRSLLIVCGCWLWILRIQRNVLERLLKWPLERNVLKLGVDFFLVPFSNSVMFAVQFLLSVVRIRGLWILHIQRNVHEWNLVWSVQWLVLRIQLDVEFVVLPEPNIVCVLQRLLLIVRNFWLRVLQVKRDLLGRDLVWPV